MSRRAYERGLSFLRIYSAVSGVLAAAIIAALCLISAEGPGSETWGLGVALLIHAAIPFVFVVLIHEAVRRAIVDGLRIESGKTPPDLERAADAIARILRESGRKARGVF